MGVISLEPKYEEKIIHDSRSNKEAFTPLYNHYKPLIQNFFRYRVSDDTAADELTSVVFEKAISGLDNFQWQGVPFSAWLFRIARNTLIDFYRKQSKNHKITSLDADEEQTITDNKSVLDHIETMSAENLLYKVLQELPPREMNIIYMKFFDGYTNRLISKLTGLTESNIGTIIYRTLRIMRNHYEKGSNTFFQ